MLIIFSSNINTGTCCQCCCYFVCLLIFSPNFLHVSAFSTACLYILTFIPQGVTDAVYSVYLEIVSSILDIVKCTLSLRKD